MKNWQASMNLNKNLQINKAVSTKEMMDAKAAEKRKKRNEKRAQLENQLTQNIEEANNLKTLAKNEK